MSAKINLGSIDPANGIDISIPLNFNGSQPNAYGVEPATSTPCTAGDLVGDFADILFKQVLGQAPAQFLHDPRFALAGLQDIALGLPVFQNGRIIVR